MSTPLLLPSAKPLLTRQGWAVWLLALVLLCAVVPLLNLLVAPGSVLHLSDFAVGLLAKIMCYAICALAMDLIWGYTGILSLGHGLFFALGGYAMGMYLMRQIGHDGNYNSDLPDFMVFLDWKTLPWHWYLSDSFAATLLLVLAAPGVLALVFGFFAFRSRIKGVYFSIITQAMTFAAMLLFFRNETGFGGNNGFTDFKRILNIPLATQDMRMRLFVLTSLALLLFYLLARFLVQSNSVGSSIRGPIFTGRILLGRSASNGAIDGLGSATFGGSLTAASVMNTAVSLSPALLAPMLYRDRCRYAMGFSPSRTRPHVCLFSAS